MEDWKKIYEHTLKNICEANVDEFEIIVEQEMPKFSVDLIRNPKASNNALFSLKLDSNANNEDYKRFCEYIYTYVGENVYDFIEFDPDEEDDYD